jgi:hypothetical protein
VSVFKSLNVFVVKSNDPDIPDGVPQYPLSIRVSKERQWKGRQSIHDAPRATFDVVSEELAAL